MFHALHVLSLIVLFAQTQAFQPPNLKKLAKQIHDAKLNYRIAVGSTETPFQLQNMHVDLTSNCQTNKGSSTGIHVASLLQEPTFINRRGIQSVSLQKGGWEVYWPAKSAHGHLVCSFVNPEEILRNPEEANKENSGEEDAVNDAKLPAGRFWVYHRCWTKASLESERERRRKIQSAAAESIQARDEKVLTLTDDSTNVAEKVVSYAQAAKSMNDYRTSGYQEALYIPLYDDQVLDLAPDCIVSSRGNVYRPSEQGRLECIGDSRVEFIKENEVNE